MAAHPPRVTHARTHARPRHQHERAHGPRRTIMINIAPELPGPSGHPAGNSAVAPPTVHTILPAGFNRLIPVGGAPFAPRVNESEAKDTPSTASAWSNS